MFKMILDQYPHLFSGGIMKYGALGLVLLLETSLCAQAQDRARSDENSSMPTVALENGEKATSAKRVDPTYWEKHEGLTGYLFGDVSAIGNDVRGRPFVVLDPEGKTASGIACYFAKSDLPTLQSLSKRQRVFVSGIINGREVNDCKLMLPIYTKDLWPDLQTELKYVTALLNGSIQSQKELDQVMAYLEAFLARNKGKLSDGDLLKCAAAMDHSAEWINDRPVLKRQKSPEQYVGTGAVLRKRDQSDDIVIEGCVDGSPAQKAGLQKDDVVIAVDGISVSGKGLDEVVSAVRGELGTYVTFTIQRNGGLPEKVKIERALIRAGATLSQSERPESDKQNEPRSKVIKQPPAEAPENSKLPPEARAQLQQWLDSGINSKEDLEKVDRFLERYSSEKVSLLTNLELYRLGAVISKFQEQNNQETNQKSLAKPMARPSPHQRQPR